MTSSDKIGLIISGITGISFIIMSLFLLAGRGSFLIAGYNTMSKKEKEKYDAKALCKFMGKILLPIGIGVPVSVINSVFYKKKYINTGFSLMIVGLCLFAIIYTNTGNRFKK